MNNGRRIVCGRFDNSISFDSLKLRNVKQRIRIGSMNPQKLISNKFVPIATDGKVILYNHHIYSVRNFLSVTEKKVLNHLIVLTTRERDLILEELIDFDLKVSVFEQKFPIFNTVKYVSNLHKNFNELKRLLGEIDRLDIQGKSLAVHQSYEHLFKIERKLRFKNSLDYFFAFAYKGGYQEVFKLKEERQDRIVIAFDFNSMFVACMKGAFVEPKSVKYEDFRGENISIEQLHHGLYRVILKKPRENFFRQFHPFKYNVFNKSFNFNIEEKHEIELMLFKNEIEYYQNFFHEIYIIEGFYSKKTIFHPLRKYAENVYQDRLKYKSEKNTILSDLCKFKLITIHSSTNPKKFKKLIFNTADEVTQYISNEFMITFPEKMSPELAMSLLRDNKYFKFKKTYKGYEVVVMDFDTNESIYSLSAQILANSRMAMIQLIEKFLAHESVEICYANIDSLHISIKKSEVDNFLIKHKNIISNRLGDLKIQAIADRGYWFDVGRYWLVKNDAVVLFKNIYFNHKGNQKEFLTKRKINIVCNSDNFNYVKKIYMGIENAFTYNKKVKPDDDIDNLNFSRYRINEVENLDVAGDSYNKEILNSKKLKIVLFNKIATV